MNVKNRKFLLILFMILYVAVAHAQEEGKKLNIFLGAGIGATLIIPDQTPNQKIVADPKVAGNIPVSFDLGWRRNQIKFTWYLERFVPIIAHSYQVQIPTGTANLFFSQLNIIESSFGLRYGYKIPIVFARKSFNFYPQLGVNLMAVSRKTVANPKPEQFFQNMSGEEDILYIQDLSVSPKGDIYSLAAGFEIDTKFIGKTRLFWENLYHFTIKGGNLITYEYSLQSNPEVQSGDFHVRLNNFNSSIGIKLII